MATKKPSKLMDDIQKPGAAAPDSSSRPIIVTNRPMMQDPMVKETTAGEGSAETSPEPDKPIIAAGTKVIEPSKEAEAATPAKEEPTTPPAEATDDEEPQGATSSVPSDAAVVDAVVANATARGSEASEAQKAKEEDEKRHQLVQVLIDSKKYVVPIGQMSRRKHNRNAVLVLVLILLLVAAYLAIDLNVISVPFKLPVEFFK